MHTSHRGFTLIETLVAIAILMIAVAGPLVIASKGLYAALYAKDQSTATFLASEGLEILRNIKDDSMYEDVDPQTGFNAVFGSGGLFAPCTSNAQCGVWMEGSGGTHQRVALCTNINACLMYQKSSGNSHSYGYFNTTSAGSVYTPTLFTRSFYITQMKSDEYQVTVVVKWNEGKVANAVTMTTEMTATIL